jgi:rod shape-determining protein MreC
MRRKNKAKNEFIVFFVILGCLIISSFMLNKNINLPHFFLRDSVLYIDRTVGFSFKSLDSEKVFSEKCDFVESDERIRYYEAINSELESEILKLKNTLKINNLLSDKVLVNATVYSRGIDYWSDKLIIDKGSNDGIYNGMAVISNGGLIGITDDVSPHNSSIVLLSNSKFPVNISVKIQLKGREVYGILNKYNNGVFEVMGIVDNVEIPKGSIVVTTGLGNIFPSGIMVGTVSGVVTDNFDLSKVVNVAPGVDFDDISYVTIVKRDDK